MPPLRRMRPKHRPDLSLNATALQYLAGLFNADEALEYLVSECDVPEDRAGALVKACEAQLLTLATSCPAPSSCVDERAARVAHSSTC